MAFGGSIGERISQSEIRDLTTQTLATAGGLISFDWFGSQGDVELSQTGARAAVRGATLARAIAGYKYLADREFNRKRGRSALKRVEQILRVGDQNERGRSLKLKLKLELK